MIKYRIIEDSLGRYRVQSKYCFIWWTVQDWNWAGGFDVVFDTKESAEEIVKRLRDYKKVSKIHKVEGIV